MGAQSYQTGGQLREKALAKEIIGLKRTSLTESLDMDSSTKIFECKANYCYLNTTVEKFPTFVHN